MYVFRPNYFVRALAGDMGIREARLSDGALTALEGHVWPGNVRELRNVIERGLVNARGGDVEATHLGLAPTLQTAVVRATRRSLR